MFFQIVITLVIMLCFLMGSLSFELCSATLKNWFEKLVPSLFVTTLLIRTLNDCGAMENLSKKCCRFSLPLFNISQNAFFLVLSSFLLGAPCSAAMINSLCAQQRIAADMGKRLITCCCMATPSFIITTCGALLLNNIKYGLLLWTAQCVACLFLLFCFRTTFVDIRKEKKKISVMESFQANLLETWKTLFLIGGYLMVTLVSISMLVFFLPEQIREIIKCLSEFTYGCMSISASALSLNAKMLLMSALLGFNGLTTWAQVFSLTPACRPSLITFLNARIVQMLISCSFIFLAGVR